jgi:hypothetical protein
VLLCFSYLIHTRFPIALFWHLHALLLGDTTLEFSSLPVLTLRCRFFYFVKLSVFLVQIRGRLAIERAPPRIFKVTSSRGCLVSVIMLLPFLFLAKKSPVFLGLRNSAPSARLSRLLPHARFRYEDGWRLNVRPHAFLKSPLVVGVWSA